MEKLRGLLSPGKDKDDQAMYGSEEVSGDTANLGKLSGQGSHFSGHQTSDVGGASSSPSITTAHGSAGQSDQTYQTENAAPNQTSTASPEAARDTNNGGPHPAANVAANKAFQSQNPIEQEQVPGAFPAYQENPYKTSKLDPRVDSQPYSATSQPTPTQPATKQDAAGPRQTGNYGGDAGALPEHEKSHAGRDAGLATGAAAGGAAVAAHEHEKHKEKQPSTTEASGTQPTSAEPTSRQPATARTTTGPSTDNNNTTTTGAEDKPSLKDRAAAAVGLGGAAKEHESHKDPVQESPTGDNSKNDYHNTWQGVPGDTAEREHGKDPSSSVRPTHGSAKAPSFLGNLTGKDTTGFDDNVDQTNHERSARHTGTEAAGAGAAGAGAAGIAEHEAKKHDQARTAEPGYNSNSGVTKATGGTHPSVANDTAHGNPSSNQPTSATGTNQQVTHPEDHHYGRDAALAGAGAAGVGGAAYEAEKHRQPPQETNVTTGDHFNNQRHDPATTTSTAQNNNSSIPAQGHHYGRDAASASGAGAAYEAERYHQPAQQTSGSTGDHLNQQRYDPVTSKGAPQNETGGNQPHDHHYGRDAALAGGAGAAVGGTAYEVDRHHKAQQDPTQPRQPTQPTQPTQTTAPTQPREPQTYHGAATTSTDPAQRQTQEAPEKDRHVGKDVAEGTAVAGGAGAIGYEEAKREQKAHEKELAKEQKAHEKEIAREQKAQEKAAAKEQKTQGKEIEKEHKAHEKAVAKEQKAQEKEIEKEHKKHDKAVAKEQKAHEKEVAKEQKAHEKTIAEEEKRREKDEKEEKPGLIDRLLHRKKDDELEEEGTHDHRAAEGAAAAGVAGAGAYEYEKHHDKEQHRDQGLSPGHTTQDKALNKEDPHHHRAAEGAAATGAAGAGAHEYEKHHDRQAPQDRAIAQQDQHDHRAAEGTAATGLGGAGAYEYEKHHNKEQPYGTGFAEEHSTYDRALNKEDPHDHRAAGGAAATGAAGAGAYEYEKHRDRQTPQDKAIAQEGQGYDTREEEKEKKPGLIERLLHRHKKDDDREEEDTAAATEGNRERQAVEGAGAAGVAGAGAHEYEERHAQPDDTTGTGNATGQHERNRLHKDPPASVVEAMYAEKPTTGYAAQVTGGTGTTGLAQGESGAHGSHLTGVGNSLDPSIRDRQSNVN